MTSSAPPPAEQAPTSQGARRSSPADAVVTAIQDRITDGHYVPGTRLTLTELHGVTGYSSAELRPALEQLARTGLVHGRWRVVDHRPSDHTVHRTRSLLAAMIEHRAYPPGTELPLRTSLAKLLLTNAATVSGALHLLAADGVLHLPGNLRPRVPAPAHSAPSRAAWPPGFADVLRALPQQRRTGASYDRGAIRDSRDTAHERWRSGICLPADVMTVQETRQGDILCRLVLAAYEQVDGRSRGEYPRLRSAAARAMACATQPVDGLLYERLFRFTVLATALADLADEVVSRPARHHTIGML
ncbi:GntR family transcriptional regulator [Streptomyces sp. NPDC051644]|uniref:GntR family transcriptional regulator n=1 Tax=Streptomyces sp. NPDC051644 TaxID=3365666 RepID=UPI0037B4FC15